MKRREFITLLGGAAAWPLAARAQQPSDAGGSGVLRSSSLGRPGCSGDARIRQGLKEAGYSRVRTSRSSTAGPKANDRLPALAADLVRRKVR